MDDVELRELYERERQHHLKKESWYWTFTVWKWLKGYSNKYWEVE